MTRKRRATVTPIARPVAGDRLLTAAEILELTELTQRAAQIRWLRQNGVRHYVSGLGNPRVYLSALTGGVMAVPAPRVEPDWAALEAS